MSEHNGTAVVEEVSDTATDRPVEWKRVEKVLKANYHNPDIEAARVILSAIAAHRLKHSMPVWVLAIAPPGSAKTDLLESIRDLERTHFIDEITPKTFISGKVDEPGRRRQKPASLLQRIGSDGIIVAADFSTYTADPSTLKVILAQFRRIYDGNYSRQFGTDENLDEREWKGRLTFLAGAVPDIDRHYALFQKLGERFLRIRWPRPVGAEAGLKALCHTNELASELRAAVHQLLLPILSAPQNELGVPALTHEMEIRIVNLSELIALARSNLERDRSTREIVGVPITEGNTRLPQQLCQLARGAALLSGRVSVIDEDYLLVCRAALDSLPPVRCRVLTALVQGENSYTLGLPSATVFRALEDFQAVGILDGDGADGKQPKLSAVALELVEQARLEQALLSRNSIST